MIIFKAPIFQYQNKSQTIVQSRKRVCRIPFRAVFKNPFLGGEWGDLNAIPIFRTPKIPLNGFRPQNFFRRLKNTEKKLCAACINRVFPKFLHSFLPYNSPLQIFWGCKLIPWNKNHTEWVVWYKFEPRLSLPVFFYRTDATLHQFPKQFKWCLL